MTAQTFAFLAPNPYQEIAARGGTVYTADSQGLITGVPVLAARDLVGAGCIPLGPTAAQDAAAWNMNAVVNPPQIVNAAGATQGNAAKITKPVAIVTTPTASTEGVIVEAVSTNGGTLLISSGTKGFKVYPPVGGKFDSVTSTNEAIVVAAHKAARVFQLSATLYQLVKYS